MARYPRRDTRFHLASMTMSSFVPQPQIEFTTSDAGFHSGCCSHLANHRFLSEILVRDETETHILFTVEECRKILTGRRTHFLQ